MFQKKISPGTKDHQEGKVSTLFRIYPYFLERIITGAKSWVSEHHTCRKYNTSASKNPKKNTNEQVVRVFSQ